MSRRFPFSLGVASTLAAVVLALGGCPRGMATSPSAVASCATTSAPSTASAPSAAAELDALDPRAPVPLLPQMAWHQKQNMQDHLVAVQEIVAALAKDDLEAAARSASRVGLSDRMQQQCEHMGQGAAGFTERALAFHRQADDVAARARAGDKQGALSALATTLTTCTSCHASYKQDVVTEAEWSARVGLAAPAMEMHGRGASSGGHGGH